MPITIQYGNPGAVMIGGIAAGTSRSREAREREMRRLRITQYEREQDRRARLFEQQTDWQNRLGMQRLGFGQEEALQKTRFGQQQELQKAGFDNDQAMQEALAGRAEAHDARMIQGQQALQDQEIIAKGLKEGRLYYTPEQKRQIADLNQWETRAANDRRFSLEERQKAIGEIRSRRSAIRPMEKPADEQPVPIGQRVQGEVFWDGGQWGRGTPWTRDPKTGVVQVPRGWKPPDQTGQQKSVDAQRKAQEKQNNDQWSAYRDAYETARKELVEERKAATLPDQEGNPRPITFPRDEEIVERMRTGPYGKRFGVPQQPQQGAQQQQVLRPGDERITSPNQVQGGPLANGGQTITDPSQIQRGPTVQAAMAVMQAYKVEYERAKKEGRRPDPKLLQDATAANQWLMQQGGR